MEYRNSGDFKACEWRSDIYTETGADYSLPDYNGDVRKILFTDVSVRPAGSFENGDDINFSGIIVYNMVYSDSENRINSVTFTSDYDLSVKCDSDKYISSFIDTSVSNYTMRLLGPRKISAKATLSSKVIVEKEENQDIEGSAFEVGEVPEVEMTTIDVATAAVFENVEREYAEELLRLDGVGADDIKIIYSDAECIIDSVIYEENGVCLKGGVRVFVLTQCDDEPIVCSERLIKIDESVPFDKPTLVMKIIPRASVSSVRCNVNADEEGTTVVANIIVDLSAEGYNNECVSLVRDAYRCDIKTENQYGEYKFYELLTVVNEKEEFSALVDKESIELENPREIICLCAEAKTIDINIEDGVAGIHGEIQYKGIAAAFDENGNLAYHPFKYTDEFVKEVTIGCQNEQKIRIIPTLDCTDSSASIDENKLYLNCRMSIKLVALKEKSEKILISSETVEGEVVEETGAKITVYYPENDESVFDIAKKFRTTVEKIIADNPESRMVSADVDGKAKTKRLIIF